MPKDWAESLKVGDWVIVEGRNVFERRQILRETAKHFVVPVTSTEYKFSKLDLSCKVDSWTYLFLKEDTEENRATLHRNTVLKSVQSMAHQIYNSPSYHKMDTEHLDIIKEKMEALLTFSKASLDVVKLREAGKKL